ncbi:exo-beta-N-acetylmuramidase NamZ domain-containing protein [Desulfotruncus alcoholivorax]|uniref:exo-beta-N-acetylmuramidase NamZ domain-containing protein n=1 Tax=Desulfotruncus alcoholivorax TaxID=265477 RepID=UPI000403BF2A|nr:exo-beta-N-acetylmuramidase NamZ domain-containing protein [Desulfotruncus alcoholivorax]
MKKILLTLLSAVLFLVCSGIACAATAPGFKLGDEMLMVSPQYHQLIEGKKIGLVTNQTGVNSRGESTIDVLAGDASTRLIALFAPEHGLDGKASAGRYVKSYTHPQLGIPVYSLYGSTRMPTEDMLQGIDALVFDIQDIGSRTYTYMSTLNYCMVAAQKYGKQIIVLDRPNPVGGNIVDGPVLEKGYETFVGVDNLPMAHGMTAGELAKFFNRKIGANLVVVPMQGYNRNMIFEDTGLTWVQTSPMLPDLYSARCYMATGLGEGTGIGQQDYFKWVGGSGIDARKFADLLNGSGLPGVKFIPEQRGQRGGVRLDITDPRTFNPARTGFYVLAYAHSLNNFQVPKSIEGKDKVMFDKIMGTNKIGLYLEQGLTPRQIEAKYTPALNQFKEERKKYLIYRPDNSPGPGDVTGDIVIKVNGSPVTFDSPPYIDQNGRTVIPLRAVTEALGAEIKWDVDASTATIIKSGIKLEFVVGSKLATVNGGQRSMDTEPVLKNNRIMIPLRYVGEYLGAKVGWNNSTRTVTVDY